MTDYFRRHKEKTVSALNKLFLDYSALKTIDPLWRKDLYERLAAFACEGKMIRGALVILSYELFQNQVPDDLYWIAASMELLQSAFLIQDDIMDRDPVRRGKPSFYKLYETEAEQNGYRDPAHAGISMAICAGDIAIFSAYGALSRFEAKPEVFRKLVNLLSAEFQHLGMAQMLDVEYSRRLVPVKIDSIIDLYRYKTARYTFSLPLLCGAIAAEADEASRELLSSIGENLGILFQIKDDELGLFGDESQTGKPVGSDIREGKKTLYHYYLYKSTGTEVREKLDTLFGNPEITGTDVDWIRGMVKEKEIDRKINLLLEQYFLETEKQINTLSGVNEEYRKLLINFLRFNARRKN